MNWKSLAPLAIALLLGTLAAVVARTALSSRHVAAAPAVKTVNVVVAKANIGPGQELTADHLGLGPIAAEVPPPEAFTNPADLVGRVVAAPLIPGQPVVQGMLAPKGSGFGLQALVPQGMRAVTLDVSESGGLAGLLMPGSHVDVVCTFNDGDTDKTAARTIVQNALVTAVGTRLATRAEPEKEAQPFRNVTLIVSPREAATIELASSVARTRLVLRGVGDQSTGGVDAVTFWEIRGKNKQIIHQVAATQPATQPTATAKPVVQVRRPHVTVIQGGEEHEIVFEVEGGPGQEVVTARTLSGQTDPRKGQFDAKPIGAPDKAAEPVVNIENLIQPTPSN